VIYCWTHAHQHIRTIGKPRTMWRGWIAPAALMNNLGEQG